MEAKKAIDSLAISTRFVLPNDTNMLNNLFGGQLMAWMDEIASISAKRHCNRSVVTASVNNISFKTPIPLGANVTLEAKVSRAFNTSMEVVIDVYVEDTHSGDRTQANSAVLNFVAVNEMMRPVKVPELIPESEEEKERYAAALRRKQLSLVLAGKLKAKEATELKSLFE